MDHGSSHRGEQAARELEARSPTLILVHLPTHASWRNQIARYCSIAQRKVLPPNDFADLAAVEQRRLACEALSSDTARPFAWCSTRAHLEERLAQLSDVLRSAMALPQAA